MWDARPNRAKLYTTSAGSDDTALPPPLHLDQLLYRREKQHMRPVRPRNHRHPMKRTTERMAVAISRNWKKPAVRLEVVACRDTLAWVGMIANGGWNLRRYRKC